MIQNKTSKSLESPGKQLEVDVEHETVVRGVVSGGGQCQVSSGVREVTQGLMLEGLLSGR